MDENKIQSARKKFKEKQIGVLMGGMSSEREISLKTGAAILSALIRKGYRAVPVEADSRVAERLQQSGIEVAFIALHGTFGEDGTVQGLLEMLGVPYTGSGVLASALAINKVASKKIFLYHGLPTPDFQVLDAQAGPPDELSRQITLPCPVVIKPAEEGSTIGISLVSEKEKLAGALAEASRYDRQLLVEKYIAGRELTAAVLDGRPLPLVEIIPEGGFYDYEAKYLSRGKTHYIVDPAIGEAQGAAVKELAVRAFQALGCSGAARVDFMLSDTGEPFILEINTIPGMTETSLLPKAALKAGLDFEALVEQILWGASVHKQHPQIKE